jgi:hypothetical protein
MTTVGWKTLTQTNEFSVKSSGILIILFIIKLSYSNEYTHKTYFLACVLFLNIWYLTCYIFQGNQYIFHFIDTIRKTDANKNLCLNEDQTNYSWVYKDKIPSKKVKVKSFLQIGFKLYWSNYFKHKFNVWTGRYKWLICPSNIGRELDRFIFLSNTLNVVPTRIRLYERHWMLNKLINYLQIIPWKDILMF